MKTQTDEELLLQNEIENFGKALRQIPRERVAYGIIKMFMQLEAPADELRNEFHDWLLSPANAAAKDRALRRCFDEMMDQDFAGLSETRQAPVRNINDIAADKVIGCEF